jgi:flavorubredoxin
MSYTLYVLIQSKRLEIYIICCILFKISENRKRVNILIVFYTRYGNTAGMAEEISHGIKEIREINVTIKRIADDVPMDVIAKSPSWSQLVENVGKKYPLVSVDDLVYELPKYDAIIFGHLLDLAIWQHR